MPSPFPGMDPYIESSGEWGDFHTSLLGVLRAELNARLPSRYRAKIDVFVFVQAPRPQHRRRRLEPDVFIRERPDRKIPPASTAVLEAPMVVTLPRTPRRQKSVVIYDRRGNSVVTVVEVLSPINKDAGEGREAYLLKRGEYLANKVNLVELDFLRGGARLPLGNPLPEIADYYALVCRAWQFPQADLWNLSLRDPLPQLPIPLAKEVADTLLPLRVCVDRVYDEGSYDEELPYDEPLSPRPRKSDSAWIRQVLADRE
jgi:hypothetical protein